jgi:hypothetical protein
MSVAIMLMSENAKPIQRFSTKRKFVSEGMMVSGKKAIMTSKTPKRLLEVGL